MTAGVRCMMMRGGTSKGAYFLREDLPSDVTARDDLLLRILGSPDPRQIDGIGGGHPLTSKVAVISRSLDDEADVDYLFLQVQVDEPLVSDQQTCGNLLAGVGPFAIERGIVTASDGVTDVRIRQLNQGGGITIARIQTPGSVVSYDGDAMISGSPFLSAPIPLEFPRSQSSLLPTGSVRDSFAGFDVTCVNAGMPVVLIRADALGISGYESPTELEQNDSLRRNIESVRLLAGAAMGLGDVTDATVPKVSIVASPMDGGSVSTRTFIPKRVHTSIGVLGAVSVAAGALIPDSVAHDLLASKNSRSMRIEHPTGFFDVEIAIAGDAERYSLERSAVLRTARKLFDGTVWPRPTLI
jgi:4-oxalomesaconate tautomerase